MDLQPPEVSTSGLDGSSQGHPPCTETSTTEAAKSDAYMAPVDVQPSEKSSAVDGHQQEVFTAPKKACTPNHHPSSSLILQTVNSFSVLEKDISSGPVQINSLINKRSRKLTQKAKKSQAQDKKNLKVSGWRLPLPPTNDSLLECERNQRSKEAKKS